MKGQKKIHVYINQPSSCGVHFMTSEIITSLDSDSKADSSDLFIFLIGLSIPKLCGF